MSNIAVRKVCLHVKASQIGSLRLLEIFRGSGSLDEPLIEWSAIPTWLLTLRFGGCFHSFCLLGPTRPFHLITLLLPLSSSTFALTSFVRGFSMPLLDPFCIASRSMQFQRCLRQGLSGSLDCGMALLQSPPG